MPECQDGRKHLNVQYFGAFKLDSELNVKTVEHLNGVQYFGALDSELERWILRIRPLFGLRFTAV